MSIAQDIAPDDPYLEPLLGALDGIPLAIQLLADHAQGESGLARVYHRWCKLRTGLLKTHGRVREADLEASIELSIQSPRMSVDARRLLSVMGLLPAGLDEADLASLLPEAHEEAAAVLQKTRLVVTQGERIRLFVPVRTYVAGAHPPEPTDLKCAQSYFFDIVKRSVSKVGMKEGHVAVDLLAREFDNIAAMILLGLEQEACEDALATAALLSEFYYFTGWPDTQVLEKALHVASQRQLRAFEADLLFALGQASEAKSDFRSARRYYEQASSLFCAVECALGEGNCRKHLGDLAARSSDLDLADALYQQARNIFCELGDALNVALSVNNMGDIAIRRCHFEGARRLYEEALSSFRSLGYLVGVANCLRGLARVEAATNKNDVSSALLAEALELYRDAGDIDSMAWTCYWMAQWTLCQVKRDEHLAAARDLWRQLGREDLLSALAAGNGTVPEEICRAEREH